MANPPSAAAALFPHLPQSTPEPAQRREANPIAAAMYPTLVPKPKPPSNPYRDALLRNLKELNAQIDARMQREQRKE